MTRLSFLTSGIPIFSKATTKRGLHCSHKYATNCPFCVLPQKIVTFCYIRRSSWPLIWSSTTDSLFFKVVIELTTNDKKRILEDLMLSCNYVISLLSAYYWVDSYSRSSVPSTAIQGGQDCDGDPIYVGRAFHEGDWVPAKVIPNKNCAYIPYGGAEHMKDQYQVGGLLYHKICIEATFLKHIF